LGQRNLSVELERGVIVDIAVVIKETAVAAYWLSRCKVNDPVEYKKYTDLVPGIIAKYGGKVLARGSVEQLINDPHLTELYFGT
jgi:hypothetical protein